MIDPDFWKDRRVFLTGHTGFKGSWLSLWLASLGAKVTGFAIEPPTDPAIFDVANVDQGLVRSVYGDVRDADTLSRAMQEAAPDIVIHMAAQSLVRESFTRPALTYETNVMGTVYLLEAVRTAPSVKVVLNVTTDKCYENEERTRGYREDEPMGGHDPYSNSKACSELISSAYRRSFLQPGNIAMATARAGNVIGGGDWATDRIVPDALRAFTANKVFRVRNPRATRPWQHVLEPLSGYLVLCEQLWRSPQQFAEAWNFGPKEKDTRPVSVLADCLMTAWGENAQWQHDSSDHPHEAGYLQLDCSKARTILKWEPIWDLEQAITVTLEWHKAWLKQDDMHAFTLRQIKRYQDERLRG